MADLTRLRSATDASETRYAPLSWLAVASLAVGGVFVITLLVLGGMAFWGGKSLYPPLLLAVPILGVLLAFAARRAIRNSEGARTGLEYANAGWWLCVASGLCFAAYLFAIDWSIRSDAQRQLTGWVNRLIAANPTDPDDPETKAAYVLLINPPNQKSPEVTNPNLFKAEHGQKLMAFRQTNLLLLAARNKDTAKLTLPGLESWEQQEADTTCNTTAVLACAEGEFPVVVKLRAVTADNARLWQVLPAEAYIPEDAGHKPVSIGRTRYGWLVDRAIDQAADATRGFLTAHAARPTVVGQGVAQAFAAGRMSRDGVEPVLLSAFPRQAVLGVPGAFWAGFTAPAEDFYAREDGKPISADERNTLAACFALKASAGEQLEPPVDRVMPPGRRNPIGTIRNPIVTVADDRITVRAAVELRPDTAEFQGNSQVYLPGRLVWVCDDPQAVKEFRDAKAAGGPLSETPPADVAAKKFRFRLTRLESNGVRLTPPRERQMSAGGGPGM